MRRQSLRKLSENAVSEGNWKELIETTSGSNAINHSKPLEMDCQVQILRRSTRAASQVTVKPLNVDADSVGNVKELIETAKGSFGVDHSKPLEVDCKVQSLRSSMRVASQVTVKPLNVDADSVGNVKELIETAKSSFGVDHSKPLEVDCKVQRLRRSMRVASQVTVKPLNVDADSVGNVKELIETTKASTGVDHLKPLELDCKVPSQRRSMRLALVSSGARKELDEISQLSPKIALEKEKDCKLTSFQNWMQSSRLAAASNRVMNRGVVNLEVTDEEKVVSKGLNADLALDRNISGCASRKKRDCHKDKRRKKEKGNKVEDKIDKMERGECCGSVEWTKEQEEALQKAYIKARPSPHFWKKVSRMVPRKSAQECFDKVHASFSTPTEPRSRRLRKSLSPIGNFSLSDGISSHISEFEVGRLRSCKTKKLAAQTVRHLLRKHCLADKRNVADHFSLLESSPINVAVDIPYIQCPITSCNTSNSPSLGQKPGDQTSANVKMYSRFKLSSPPDRPSPEVLKQVKNRALHDKYIDELHRREARRSMLGKKSTYASDNKRDRKTQCDTLKAARTALLSDAKSFMNYFQHTQADMHDLDNEDIDGNYDGNEDDDTGDINE